MMVFILLLVCISLLLPSPCDAMSCDEMAHMRRTIADMIDTADQAYMLYAFPADELTPVSCNASDTWGGFAVQLIDALDTFLVLGRHRDFHARVLWYVRRYRSFDRDVNVSVFETNIRILGALVAAHAAYATGLVPSRPPPSWGVDSAPYNGELLALAVDLGDRLLRAFDTPTGLPFGTVNLRHGVPPGETPIVCTACAGTFLLEFGALSCLSGHPRFIAKAQRAVSAIHAARDSTTGLIGSHVSVKDGSYAVHQMSIGASVDSLLEYLHKAMSFFEDGAARELFEHFLAAIETHVMIGDWPVEVAARSGHLVAPVFNSLAAFWPSMLASFGHHETARRLVRNIHAFFRRFGALPEGLNLVWRLPPQRQRPWPLRPELVESIWYLHRATGDPAYLAMGRDIAAAIIRRARTFCGYATLSDVLPDVAVRGLPAFGPFEDRMETFLIAETLKYLYLLFDPHNPYATAPHAFNTEAHPLPVNVSCSAARGGRWHGSYPHAPFMGKGPAAAPTPGKSVPLSGATSSRAGGKGAPAGAGVSGMGASAEKLKGQIAAAVAGATHAAGPGSHASPGCSLQGDEEYLDLMDLL
eukprot:TRINITY_DN35581_c0_g1_i1.p1 TRINITY_DN35581_c0_g1~~TRINITY_DN35581_c0_g1_i1.p1  ORF type:complete len:585 (+),score=96.72 TRINITY_DN35581_c0_g1_i1:156-1910(+)